MKSKSLLVAAAVAAVAALVIHICWLPNHHSAGPVAHVENGFEFTAHGPYEIVAPLFGGLGERAWGGGHWNPQFLYPFPAKDSPGEVFTIAHGHVRSTWINTAFDLDTGHLQYVYVIPDAQAVVIDVRLSRKDAASTGVKVTYQRTALDAGLNRHVMNLGQQDALMGPEWAKDIDAYLTTVR